MMRLYAREDRGQVTAFVVIITLALILLFALVAEGGAALSTRSRALTLAQEAARAGAQELDLASYRAGQSTALNASAAQQSAQSFLARSGAEGSVRIDGATVTVTARLDYTFRMLPLGTRSLSATASAAPHTA